MKDKTALILLIVICSLIFGIKPTLAYNNGLLQNKTPISYTGSKITGVTPYVTDNSLSSYITVTSTPNIEYDLGSVQTIKNIYINAENTVSYEMDFEDNSHTSIGYIKNLGSSGQFSSEFKNWSGASISSVPNVRYVYINYSGSTASKLYEVDVNAGLSLPSTPTGLKYTENDPYFNITWNAVSNATKYSIYISSGEKFSGISPTTKSLDVATFAGKTVYVTAVNANGESGPSNSISLIDTLPPSAPSNLSITGRDNSATLNWDTVPRASLYNIYENLVKMGSTSENSYTLSDVPVGSHTFYVIATNNNGESTKSNEADYNKAPNAPIISVSNVTGLNAIINWDSVPGASSYDILINDSYLDSTTNVRYTLNDLIQSTDYSVKVIAKSNSGNSEAGTLTFTTKSAQSQSEGTQATDISSTSATVSWKSVVNAVVYKIYKGEDIVGTATDTVYSVDSLNPGAEYIISIVAFNDTFSIISTQYSVVTTLNSQFKTTQKTGAVLVSPDGKKFYDTKTKSIKDFGLLSISNQSVLNQHKNEAFVVKH